MPCGAGLEIGWIPVRRTVSKDDDVHASDHVEVHVKLLPILEHGVQADILRQELEKRGWTRNADGSLTKVFGEAIATLPAGGSTITLEVSEQTRVSATATVDGRAKEEDIEAQDAIGRRAAEAAAKKLAQEAEAAKAELIAKNIRKLERVQEDLQQEVNEVVNATTKRSLEQRAAELGTIESVNETRSAEGGYELTITVRT
jgi:FtsH ternary system-associated peptide